MKYQAKSLSGESGIHQPDDPKHSIHMIDVPEGEFQMGSENGESDEKPVHTVRLGSFQLSATLVTQELYENIMGVNPSHFKSDEGKIGLPVENVSWKDAMVFCEQLTKVTEGNGRYTLPTEAQWEYACRAGTDTEFYTGNDKTHLDQAGWYSSNSQGQTHPVGKKAPNDFNLYDMHGNVWEWCLDWYDSDYYSECNKKGVVSNPAGPENGSGRVLRGGSWVGGEQGCRSASRDNGHPEFRYGSIGFRLVFVP
jgi:formylglycine-generating enzyme required for sulfatase activity